MSARYTIDLTEKQMRIIQEALEQYARVGSGQIDYILPDDLMRGLDRTQHIGAVRQILEIASQHVTGLDHGAYYGAFHPSVPPQRKLAWDMLLLIRKATYSTVEEDKHSVCLDPVYQTSQEDLPSIVIKDAIIP